MKKLLVFSMMCLIALSMQAQRYAVLQFKSSAGISIADVDGISEMFGSCFRPSGYTEVDRSSTLQAEQEQKRKAEQERRAAELKAQGLVDLGLPSGTLWRDRNEEGGFYTYEQAMNKFGDKLPTKEQLEELKNKCSWSWTGNGYKVTGPNGNSIVLPASGSRLCDGNVYYVGSFGYYWSSTPDGSDDAWYLYFFSDEVDMDSDDRCYGNSVRLVQD